MHKTSTNVFETLEGSSPERVPHHLYPQLISTAHLPKPFRRSTLIIISSVYAVTSSSIYGGVVYSAGVSGHLLPVVLLHIVLFASTFYLFLLCIRHISQRRRDAILRFLIVAECNHHIRNALQQVSAIAYLGGCQQMDAPVHSIDVTLSEILPLVYAGQKKSK